MTGPGEGYCAVQILMPGEAGHGVAGLEGRPVRAATPARSWLRPWTSFGRGRDENWGAGKGAAAEEPEAEVDTLAVGE